MIRQPERLPGLRLAPRGGGAWPMPHGRVFEILFTPLLEALSPLHWIVWNYEGGPFDSLACEEYDDTFLDGLFLPVACERGNESLAFSVLRPAYLPALARYVYTDWVDILGTSPEESSALEIADRLVALEWTRCGVASERLRDSAYATAKRRIIATHGEIFLHCHDGAEWHLYLADARQQARAREQFERLEGLRVEAFGIDGLG